jgi:hypothetical protein
MFIKREMLAVVVSDVEVADEYQFERRQFGSNPARLRLLSEWLMEQQVEEVVMESTAQYWKPVWQALERYWKPSCQKREDAPRTSGTLHLAQGQSNRGRRGRKRDFPDAERLVKRLVAREWTLRFVPDADQRLWRTVTHASRSPKRIPSRQSGQLPWSFRRSLAPSAPIDVHPGGSSRASSFLRLPCRGTRLILRPGPGWPAAFGTEIGGQLLCFAART